MDVDKILLTYPNELKNLSSFRGGPSKNAEIFLAGMNTLKYAGRVHRFCPEKKHCTMDDPYFTHWCKLVNNAQGPRDLWPNYDLAVPNKAAGYLSLLKYDKLQPDALCMDLWNETMTFAEKHFIAMSNSKVRDLTLPCRSDKVEQEIAKEEQIEQWTEIVDDVEKRASAGYPWTHWFRTKGELFEYRAELCDRCLDECRLVSKSSCACRFQGFMRDYCSQYWEDLANEDCRPCFWTNNVKEEIRPIEKLAINKLRTFIGGATEHVVANSQLNGDMNQKQYDSVHTHWSFVGGTKFYRGWNKMFKRLSRHPNAFELDESEFDSSLFREAMYGMMEFRWRMLHPQFRTAENRNRLRNVYRDIVDSYIVTQDGDVVQKNTGNSSGSGNTINDNTVILYRLLAYAWLVLCEEQRKNWTVEYFNSMRTFVNFHKHVEAALTGDDNTWTCSDEVVGWFNAKSVSRVWLSVGVKTTSPCYEARKLDECRFLSAGFLEVDKCMVPVPEHVKTMASLAFHDPSPMNPRWSLLRACALRIESFWCYESRVIISEYISWLLKNFDKELHSAKDVNDTKDIFTFEQVYSVYKTDNEIKQLYLMNESYIASVQLAFTSEVEEIYQYGLMGSAEFNSY